MLSQEDRRSHRAGPAGQRLSLDSALVGPYPPAARAVRRDEVHVRPVRQRLLVSERPATADHVDLLDVVYPHDQVWHPCLGEADPAFASFQPKWQLRLDL